MGKKKGKRNREIFGTTCSNYFYTFYREWCRRRRWIGIKDRKEAMALRVIVWHTILEHYLENEGGVYLENLGYLCHMIIPNQSVGNKICTLNGKAYRNGYRYRHVCLEIRRNRAHYFYLDLSKATMQKSREAMRRGRRYRFLYREVLASLYTNKSWRPSIIYEDKFLSTT